MLDFWVDKMYVVLEEPSDSAILLVYISYIATFSARSDSSREASRTRRSESCINISLLFGGRGL